MAGAIRAEEEKDNTSFYSNALDALDQSSVISNRQRLNDTHPPVRPVGAHLESNLQPPAEHQLREASKNAQHARTQSKANADLADELNISSVRPEDGGKLAGF